MKENILSGSLSKDISDSVKQLWHKYQLPYLKDGVSVITADFGRLGSIVIRRVLSFDEPSHMKYESGSYDYVSIVSDNIKKILWTDFEDEEPYNRQGGLYADGVAFSHFDSCTNHESYREFLMDRDYTSNIHFAVWGYSYNSFYQSIRFGIVIDTKRVNDFISELRFILGKSA